MWKAISRLEKYSASMSSPRFEVFVGIKSRFGCSCLFPYLENLIPNLRQIINMLVLGLELLWPVRIMILIPELGLGKFPEGGA
jgi:hypothetical protein